MCEVVDVHVTYRHCHYPALFVRDACVEDSDDLLPVLLQHSNTMPTLYGKLTST